MKKPILLALLFVFSFSTISFSQDTLPNFSVINAGNNRIIIGWVNHLQNVAQISIQRSFDSLRGYTSILTVADPTTVQNGYLDAKAPNDHMFYRLFIMQDKGVYQFSRPKKPYRDTSSMALRNDKVDKSDGVTKIDQVTGRIVAPDSALTKPVVLKLNGFTTNLDSIQSPTGVAVKKKTENFVPSIYVYTCRDGYVCIHLPEAGDIKDYTIKFFDEESPLFELKELREKDFKIDKANFYHAGWFRFEIYKEGKLFEKHKFYLEKEF